MLFTSVPQNTANYWYTAKTARLQGKSVEHMQGTTVFPLCHPHFSCEFQQSGPN